MIISYKLERFEDGTLMSDLISYQTPFGFIGSIANRFITRILIEIFEYRKEILARHFGADKILFEKSTRRI